MNSYENYLESLLELREKEIDLYREFIENELRCTIKEEVLKETKFDKDKKGVRQVRFKVITIPQSQYILQLDD